MEGTLARSPRRHRDPPSPPLAPVEFLPVGVHRLDEGDLSRAGPLLQGFFAGDGVADVEVLFVPDEALAAVAAGEALGRFRFVFEDAAGEVGRHADVERAAPLRRHDVDVSRHEGMVLGGGGGVKAAAGAAAPRPWRSRAGARLPRLWGAAGRGAAADASSSSAR